MSELLSQLAILDGAGNIRYVQARLNDNGTLIAYSAPTVGGTPVSADNPLPTTGEFSSSTASAARAATVPVGGQAVDVFIDGDIGAGGGFIQNPINAIESLFVDPVNNAAVGSNTTCSELLPGQTYYLPANLLTTVSANAATSGHAFTAIAF
jgi:hypothetical protein